LRELLDKSAKLHDFFLSLLQKGIFVLDCFVAISHELDCLLQLKLLLAAFLLECLCFGFLTVEAHIDALDVAPEVFKLLLKIADLGFLSF
jgi:hypothetical protein